MTASVVFRKLKLNSQSLVLGRFRHYYLVSHLRSVWIYSTRTDRDEVQLG